MVFQTATAFETPRRIADLIGWARTSLDHGALHPLLAVGVFVAVLLAIHPFQDRNGRLSRILTTLLLLRAGYEYVPFGVQSLRQSTGWSSLVGVGEVCELHISPRKPGDTGQFAAQRL